MWSPSTSCDPSACTTQGGHTTDPTSAADRIHRVFGRFISAGYVFYLLFVVPTAVSQAHLTAWWWLPTALLAIFGTGIALGVATFLSDVRWIGRLAAANAVAFLVVAVLWFPAWTGEVSTNTAWQALFPGVAGLSAAAAWRPRTALAYLTVVVFVVQATNYLLVNTTTGYRFVPELAFALMFCGVFAAAAIVAFRTGDVLDSTVAATERSVVAAAAAAARTVERERFDALVHDQVMSTLLASGRGASDGPVAAQARRALEMFDSLRRGDDTESSFDADRVAAQFRSAASEVDEDVEFTTATSADAGPYYPADVIRRSEPHWPRPCGTVSATPARAHSGPCTSTSDPDRSGWSSATTATDSTPPRSIPTGWASARASTDACAAWPEATRRSPPAPEVRR